MAPDEEFYEGLEGQAVTLQIGDGRTLEGMIIQTNAEQGYLVVAVSRTAVSEPGRESREES